MFAQRTLNQPLLLLFILQTNNLDAAFLDAFVSKEILDYGEKCPWVNGPSVSIINTQDYDSISICWRFLTTAYPHCGGQTASPIYVPTKDGGSLDFRIYQPKSGMSEDGRQAGWLGWKFNETSKSEGRQVKWRLILFDEPLKIHEWQSMCISYNKKTRNLVIFHNGIQYLNYTVLEEHIRIKKDFLHKVIINRGVRGSLSDLQVYSTPMEEEELKKWTLCQHDRSGNVYSWDINKFNMTHDKSILSAIEKVDTNFFCKTKETGQKEIHLFGDGEGGENTFAFSHIDGVRLCRRLNGKAALLPATVTGIENLNDRVHHFRLKANVTSGTKVWIGGSTFLGDKYGAFHTYPEPTGIWDIEDPETGKILTNEVNKKFIQKEIVTYHKLVRLCLRMWSPPSGKPKFFPQKSSIEIT